MRSFPSPCETQAKVTPNMTNATMTNVRNAISPGDIASSIDLMEQS